MPKTKTNNKKKGNTRKKTNNMKKGKTIKSTRKTKQVPKDEAVVLIHANWCPHCQTMKPEWNEMKNKLLVWIFALIVLSSFTFATLDDGEVYWSFDNATCRIHTARIATSLSCGISVG